jgi:hypothetical protein
MLKMFVGNITSIDVTVAIATSCLHRSSNSFGVITSTFGFALLAVIDVSAITNQVLNLVFFCVLIL